MRNALMALVFGCFVVGCGGTGDATQSGGADLAQPSSGGSGGGGGGGSAGGGGGGGGGSAGDMSMHASDMHHGGGGGDMAAHGDMAGLKPFGAPCTANAQCATNVCFMGGMMSFCSMHCTQATAAQDCPVPPTTGVCNNQGYCK